MYTNHGRRKAHQCILGILAAQPGPNGQVSCLHRFKIFCPASCQLGLSLAKCMWLIYLPSMTIKFETLRKLHKCLSSNIKMRNCGHANWRRDFAFIDFVYREERFGSLWALLLAENLGNKNGMENWKKTPGKNWLWLGNLLLTDP